MTLFAFALMCQGQQAVQLGFSQNGLSSLQYGGQQYLGYGNLRLNAVNFQTPQGQAITGDVTFSQQVDIPRGVVTQTFSWGTVTAAYVASANQMKLAITTSNTSPNKITGLFFDSMGLQLPSKSQEYDGVDPILGINEGSPTALRLTYNTGAVVLCNDDVIQPLVVGFPWALDRPASTLFPLKINTAQDGMYPPNIPYINRPIAPGASDTYHVSLRFGAATDTTKSLAGDVYQAFAAAYPMTLNWKDRRPIGSLIIATSAAGWPTNPRGWLLDSSINVFTPQGIASFQSRLLTWADNAVAILKGMNAQGMVTWDIEGEQYPQSTTYIGDPRIFMNLAPEMAGVADTYFKKFSDAGLRVGLCIRPQQLVVAADGSSASQQELADPTQLMIDKMTYANQRWGATLFYVDSNGDPNLPYDFNFFRRVQQALPNVLVMPEHKNTGYYSVTAPYAELRQGFASTPSSVRDVYPGAFSLINTADGPINARYADLQAAVAGGDIMMFRGWFDDGNNATIKSLYNGQTTNPPVTTILAPAAGSTVQGNVAVIAQASGASGIAGVKLLIDNVQFGSEITSGSYAWTWNSTSVSNGAHILTVVARDSQGQTGSGSETVQVNNVVAAPVVSITSPAANSTVSGTVSLAASASSSIGIASVQFSVDGSAIGTATFAPYSATWDSTKATNGSHTITALAKDTAGTTSFVSVSVTVSNVVSAPVVSITSPTANSTVGGTVSITATASSSIGIASVQFSVDGTAVGTATSAPYSATWDSTKATNGTHTLTALARDAAGTTSSASVNFTVNNVVAAPVVSITSPTANSTVNGTVSITASASSSIGIASVQFSVDGTALGTATSAPYSATWDSTKASNGTHTITALAKDTAGASSTTNITINVNNAAGPPTISITSPASGATVSGGISITASASSSIGITRVQFFVNGVMLAAPTAPPYSANWDTRGTGAGAYNITAVARDNAGFTNATSITCVVNNSVSAPIVSFTAPASGATVNGLVSLSASASSAAGIASVQFSVDGTVVATAVSAPYSAAWDSTKSTNGSHVITALAKDVNGSATSATITVNVANAVAPPTVSITSPSAGATVSGNVSLTASASSSIGIASVQFSIDGATVGTANSAPYSTTWDSTKATSGAHLIAAMAKDTAGITVSTTITVTVTNAVSPPTVSITSPASGATVLGTVSLTATASSNIGIASVQFSIDATAVGTATSAPYSAMWDSTKAANGTHTVTALAKDSAGTTSSATVTITVRNIVAPPTLTITSPALNATVSGTLNLTAAASSSLGIASVQFAVDSVPVGIATSAPYTVAWNSGAVPNGPHTLGVTAQDLSGVSTSATLAFTVNNTSVIVDTTPPQVAVTGPANNGTVSGTVNLTANASDNVGVVSVTFLLDNIPVGTATTAPYQVPLDMRTVNGGLHYLTAVAKDAAGNTGSNSISFSNGERSAPSCGTTGIGAFVGCYYASLNLTQLALTRVDAGLNFDWAWTAPDPALPASTYSIAWMGKFAFDGGNYTFELKSEGGARIYIDGSLILDQWSGQSYSDVTVPQTLQPGAHVIRVEYHRAPDAGEAKLFWGRN